MKLTPKNVSKFFVSIKCTQKRSGIFPTITSTGFFYFLFFNGKAATLFRKYIAVKKSDQSLQ